MSSFRSIEDYTFAENFLFLFKVSVEKNVKTRFWNLKNVKYVFSYTGFLNKTTYYYDAKTFRLALGRLIPHKFVSACK